MTLEIKTGRLFALRRLMNAGFITAIIVSSLILLFSGCLSYPMGLSKEQWQSLSPAQQAEYHAKQVQIDEARRQQEAELHARQALVRAEAERLERERVAVLYAEAQYGDVVIVTVQGGAMKWSKEIYYLEPVSFELVRGESKEIEFRGHVDRARSLVSRYKVKLSDDGHTFYFNSDARDLIALVDDGWDRGRSYPITGHTWNDINAGAGGMTIGIRLKEMPGSPHRVIIEHR
jgi:hypothetical protein